ncbi:DoxX family protein [Luteolibacter sp. SL250]|uniref:DoxX family protein n=1 Tax=Luteolibacter sp. SL250 TaxID=2995170 RepID=UPI0022710F7F|nr:DoxX family protein [Luteolibacter sp. SL250]WAC18497.1 DoxX family protein [Luteolibacter sp. SL250]
MKKFFFDCGTRDLTASIGILVLRVATGLLMMLAHGIPKLQNYEALRAKFKAPSSLDGFLNGPIALILTIGAEVGAAGLLILGLATRPAAFILSFTMVIAAFDVHAADPFKIKELALMYLLCGVVILLTGAGSLSLDASLCKEKRRRW